MGTWLNPTRVKWNTVTGKPTIYISGYGISNGTSDDVNNGADFGPDTPNTTTYGIAEAFDYIQNDLQENTSIRLSSGAFYINTPVHVTSSYSWDISGILGNWNESSSTDAVIDPTTGTYILAGTNLPAGSLMFIFDGTLFNNGHFNMSNLYIRGNPNLNAPRLQPTGALNGGIGISPFHTVNTSPEAEYISITIENVKFNLCAPAIIYENTGGPVFFNKVHFTGCTAGTLNGNVYSVLTFNGGSGYMSMLEFYDNYGPSEISMDYSSAATPTNALLKLSDVTFFASNTTDNIYLGAAGNVTVNNVRTHSDSVVANSSFLHLNSDMVSVSVSNVTLGNRGFFFNITTNPGGPVVANNIIMAGGTLVGTLNTAGIAPSSPVIISNVAWVAGTVGIIGATLSNSVYTNIPQG